MWKTASAAIALLAFDIALTGPALAAGCASQADASALKTAVLQQELMVAALQCREAAAYNRFVVAYRGELQSSDAALKAFFVRRGGEHGESGYDTFKTKAANLSALEQARDAKAFCADARALFTGIQGHRGSLMSFVDTKSADLGNICLESRPVMAKADVKPVRVAARAEAIKVADARPAEVAVGGVPAHSLPAIPYRQQERAAAPPPDRNLDRAPAREDVADDVRDEDEAAPSYANDVEQAPPPPPRPRYYQIRDRSYQDRDYQDRDYYPQRSYGPPPGWRDQAWREYPAPRGWDNRGYYRGGW